MWNLHSRDPMYTPIPDSAALDTVIMTVAVDLDPDDDSAMADYASRFFEPLVLSFFEGEHKYELIF